jgi:hypothetical protein
VAIQADTPPVQCPALMMVWRASGFNYGQRLFQQAVSTSGDYNTLFNIPEATLPGGAENLELQHCKSKLPTHWMWRRACARCSQVAEEPNRRERLAYKRRRPWQCDQDRRGPAKRTPG